MKAMVEFPGGWHHINQARLKRVRARSDAVELFSNDERWTHQSPFAKMSCLTILSKIAGMECSVIMSWRNGKAIMYGVALPDPVEAPGETGTLMWHDKIQFPADYFEILDSGFMEAR